MGMFSHTWVGGVDILLIWGVDVCCQFNAEMTTSTRCLCWHTRLWTRNNTSAKASTAASTHGHYARRLRHCSSNCSLELTLHQLKLKASTFYQLDPVYQQSWSRGIRLLLRRTRRFFPREGRNDCWYSLHLSHLESTWMENPPKVVTNPSTNRARRSLTSLMWPMKLPLWQTSYLWNVFHSCALFDTYISHLNRVTTFSGLSVNLEMSGNSAKVRERSGNLCSQGNLFVASRQNKLPVLYLYFNSFFIRDVHGEFGLINVHFFDILPAISSGKVRRVITLYAVLICWD